MFVVRQSVTIELLGLSMAFRLHLWLSQSWQLFIFSEGVVIFDYIEPGLQRTLGYSEQIPMRGLKMARLLYEIT